ncbi:apolipoprotein N-acyltransferase [Thermodesulfobacteriota bacterium]
MSSTTKTLLAVLTGVMLTASFPPLDLEWLAWFSLLPLLKSLEGTSPRRAFRLGLTAGLVHQLTLIYWIIEVLDHYGGLHFSISILLLLLLCLYLALYPALFASLCGFVKDSRLACLKLACLWVVLELIRAKALTGFPWCLLGYSQYRFLEIIQIADLTGVYGISFLIVLINGLIYALATARRISINRILIWELPIAVVVALLTFTYGQAVLDGRSLTKKECRNIPVAIIQGNIDQSIKWDPAFQSQTIDKYRKLTRKAARFSPDLIVWPETSVPFFFQNNPNFSPQVMQIAAESHADLIFGSPAFRREKDAIHYYNRAYIVSREGVISGLYDKVHLVPFGEYVPLKRFLPFVHRLVPAAGDFTAGDRIVPFRSSALSIGILICFEAIFPEIGRGHSANGADILVNLTNDAWFGMTSAPFQHLSMSVFRAVENRRPFLRAANTGFSAFIDINGRVISRSDLFHEEVLVYRVKSCPIPVSFYTRYGDLFAWACLIFSLLIVFIHLYNKRRRV